jgi:hypothetical protein
MAGEDIAGHPTRHFPPAHAGITQRAAAAVPARQEQKILEQLLIGRARRRLEILVIDESVVNPAAVVYKIRKISNTARLLAFLAESPLIYSSAWLEAGVDVYMGSGLSSKWSTVSATCSTMSLFVRQGPP